MLDFNDIHLYLSEKYRLTFLRLKKRAMRKYFGKYFDFLFYEAQFIQVNCTDRVDGFGAAVPDDTYSLSERYFRYCAYRRDKLVDQIIMPVIVSVIASILTSAITVLLVNRLL